MRVGTVKPLPGILKGSSDKQQKGSLRAGKRQRELAQELQQIWLSLALEMATSKELAPPVTLGITSSVKGEGKTSHALGLAVALTKETDAKVMLVECDIVSASLAAELGLNFAPGLLDHISNETAIKDAIQSTSIANLDVITAGGDGAQDEDWELSVQPSLSKLRRVLPGIVSGLKSSYAYIVLDMPPITTNIYAKEMITVADGAFLIARAGVTPMESISRAVQDIGDDRLLGVMLTGASSPVPSWITRLLTE